MRVKRIIISIIFLLAIVPAFSTTCYRDESYCSEYGTKDVNCKTTTNYYSCTLFGPHPVTEYDTCTGSSCSSYYTSWTESYWGCVTNVVSGTCSRTYTGTCYWYWWSYSCTKTDYYACSYYERNCGPQTRTVSGFKETCTDYTYDCNPHTVSVTGAYTGTCSLSSTSCDKITDYDNCLTWSDRQVAFDCTEMKLTSYSTSSNIAQIGESITASFQTYDCTGTINYKLNIKNHEYTGTANCGNNQITLTPNTAGTQTILLTLTDDRTTITKTIGILTVTNPFNPTETENPFQPANGEQFTNNIETGNYDNEIIEWINQGLSNDDIIKNLMLTFGTVGLALTLTQTNKIKNYIENLKTQKEEYIIEDYDFSDLEDENDILEFLSGLVFGSDENSSTSQLVGDVIGGLFFIGDVRDIILYILSSLDLIDREYDVVFLGLSVFGIVTEFIDIADAVVSGLKVAWKSLPDIIKVNWIAFFKKADDLVEFTSDFVKYVQNIPSNKMKLFFESVHHFIVEVPLQKLGEVVELFLKLIKYGDDMTIGLLKKCMGMEDVFKLSKYIDEVGEEAFEQLTKSKSADEIYEIIFEENVGIGIIKNTNIIQNNLDEVDEAINALKKFDDDFYSYIDDISIDELNGKYLGYYENKKISLAYGEGLSEAQAYEVMVHEGGHAIIANTQTLKLEIEGYEHMQLEKAIDEYFDNNLLSLEEKYSNVYDEIHEVAVAKVSLMNDAVDKTKWYQGFKEDYSTIFDILNSQDSKMDLFNEIIQNKDTLPKFVEIKIILEEMNDVDLLNKFNEAINLLKYSEDSFLFDDFNIIYNNYKNMYGGLL